MNKGCKQRNPTSVLKYAQGSYRAANLKGLRNEFLFYYQIKSINIQGQFFNKDIFKLLAERTKLSRNHVEKKVKSLVECDFIVKEGSLFKLVSYDKLWSILELDLTPNPKKTRKGCFLIKKFSAKLQIEDLQDEIYLFEPSYSEELQKRKAVKKLSKDKHYQKDTAKKNRKGRTKEEILRGVAQNHFVSDLVLKSHNDKLKHTYAVAKYGDHESNYCNIDTNLSCKGWAALFGYKSAAQGWNIQQRLLKKELIEIENRTYREWMSESEYVSKGFNKIPSCNRNSITGIVTFQLPNKVTAL